MAVVTTWWKRNAGWLAIVFAVLAVVLAVVAVAQALMLYWRGWRFALGTIPEWLAGVGSVAVFVTLWVTISEWRHARRERHDQMANQARGIIVEPWIPPNHPVPVTAIRFVVIRNHSTQPVLNLRAEHLTLRDKFTNFRQVDPATGDETVPPKLVPTLGQGQATDPFVVQNLPVGATVTEYLWFSFTDAHGREWERLGSDQPEPKQERLPLAAYGLGASTDGKPRTEPTPREGYEHRTIPPPSVP